MNIVCLNCEVTVNMVDPRQKFCSKVCKNRWNVKKFRAKPKKQIASIDKLRAMIKATEDKKTVRTSIQAQTYQKDEWVDPI